MWQLVVIMDTPIDFDSATINDRNLEWNSTKGAEGILNTIKKVHNNTIVYTSVERFLERIDTHKNDVVFPLLYGINSPSSKSLIPAICEAHGIRYIGADAYTHMVCNDKKLATIYTKEFGISSANSVLLRFSNPLEKRILNTLQLPLIVKPNFGGGSTGISAANIKYTHAEAYKLAEQLYKIHKMPIIIEEMLEGHEIEFIIVGNQNRILFSSEVKLVMNKNDYFTNKIWGFETKKVDDSSVDFISSNFLTNETKQKMISIFQSFSKIEFMRIDGRIKNNDFKLIELSPDCYLGDDCAVAAAFFSQKYSYEDMFKMIINNALN